MQDLLELPISEDEVNAAISGLASGKAHGPDGYTTLYYKTFKNLLSAPLTQYANYGSGDSFFRTETLHALITDVPKSGKDLTCFLLLNIDSKIYAKVLANRLLSLLPRWVSSDQTGFISGRPGKQRIRSLRTLMLIAHARRSSHPTLLLSMNTDKAFDRVDWDYLLAVLSPIGFSPSNA